MRALVKCAVLALAAALGLLAAAFASGAPIRATFTFTMPTFTVETQMVTSPPTTAGTVEVTLSRMQWEGPSQTKTLRATVDTNGIQLGQVRFRISRHAPSYDVTFTRPWSEVATLIEAPDRYRVEAAVPNPELYRDNYTVHWELTLVWTVGTQPGVARRSTSFQVGCGSATDYRAALQADEDAVLDQIGSLTTLNDGFDVAALATRGWGVLSHGFSSFEGMGVAFVHNHLPSTLAGTIVPGRPTLLLYAPATGAADVTDPAGPDFPYTLVGWAYGAPFKLSQRPKLECVPWEKWFIHERGLHTLDGGFLPVPPSFELICGTADAQDPPLGPGVPHGRLWDLHIWRTPGPNQIAIRHPSRTIPGHDSTTSPASFYEPLDLNHDEDPW